MESAISQPFINRLHNSLVNQCVTKGIIDNKIFDVQDLDEIWDKSAPQYLADAVNEIADYPMVAIAWAAYFGIGSAALWDADWEKAKNINDIYLYLRDMRGFDYIDEFVMEKMMHLSENNQHRIKIDDTLQECAQLALSLIRKEEIEPSSIEAYQMFAITAELFYKLGYTIALTELGYKIQFVGVERNLRHCYRSLV